MSMSDTTKLRDLVKAKGWNEAIYEYVRQKIDNNESILEDKRIADWRYLVRLNHNSKALLVGCGLSEEPVALADACGDLVVLDADKDKIEILRLRAKESGIGNIELIYRPNIDPLPFTNECFDLVAISDDRLISRDRRRFKGVIREVWRILKRDGTVKLTVPNRLSFQRLISRDSTEGCFTGFSLWTYRRILSETGLKEIEFYSPLPNYNTIPMFYLPLDEAKVMDYFYDDIFPLLEMVSPEVKRQYGLQYAIAKLGVRFARLSRASALTKHFFSGYMILGKK